MKYELIANAGMHLQMTYNFTVQYL